MNAKMKDCFTPHTLMHGLTGLGIGIVLVNLIPSLNMLWLGVVVVVVAMALDFMRK